MRIVEDISNTTSMNRILQGDVGAGKTDVAIISLLCAIENNILEHLMAPTEILATQHYFRIKNLLENMKSIVVCLKGKMKKKEKEANASNDTFKRCVYSNRDPCINRKLY